MDIVKMVDVNVMTVSMEHIVSHPHATLHARMAVDV
jgi:hypothetical protein